MLISLKAKNFRKHRDLSLTFTSGLNALRGANEQGKTSIIEAICYALYGAAALRDSLADTVTWGCSEKDLKVELVIRVDSALYSFSRSKSGAECNYEGGKVVGQKEVTAFAADLLGADAKTSSVLMMASQNGLRGSLDEGPTAVSGLMSKLADFDLIDRILEAANSKLLLGAEAPLQQRLTAALAELEQAQASLPQDIDRAIEELRSVIDTLAGEVTLLEGEETTALHPAMMAAHAALGSAQESNRQREKVGDDIKRATDSILIETTKMAAAERDATDRPAEAAIQALRDQVARDNDHARVSEDYQRFLKLPAAPDNVWEGDIDSLDAEILATRKRAEALTAELGSIQSSISEAERGRITSGKCPTCGHAARSDEHVAEHNATIDARIVELRKPVAGKQAERSEALAELQVLEQVKQAGRRFADATQRVSNIDIDGTTWPWTAKWNVEVPGAAPNGQAAKDLAAAEAKVRAATQAEGRVAAHRSRIAELKGEVERLTALEAAMPVIDLMPLSQAYDDAYAKYMANATVLRERRAVLDGERQKLNQLEQTLNGAMARVENARRRHVETESDLKKLAFNNGLVKKLKALKPMITDHLWNTVLAAVGTFFSQMRGEQSVVTKDKDGFKVNGQKVSSLSGSTLDVLALAIRVALTKTFIPHATFMTLDEPAHGCDTERTGNVLGFLAGVGFEQVLLASHDELSEAISDNVIALST